MRADQLAAIALVVVSLTLKWSTRWLVAAALGGWLQQHIALTPRQGIVTIPFLGDLDLLEVEDRYRGGARRGLRNRGSTREHHGREWRLARAVSTS